MNEDKSLFNIVASYADASGVEGVARADDFADECHRGFVSLVDVR